MTVLLALGDEALSTPIRKLMVEGGHEVLDDEVFHRQYLNEKIEALRPSMILISDIYLPSVHDQEPEKREAEMLELIEYWRSEYDNDLRVVYFCVRERTDPFIGQLVARNVLDIFHERSMSSQKILEQLSAPPRFINVKRLGTGSLKVDFVEEPEVEATIQEESASPDDLLDVSVEEPEERASKTEATKQVATKLTEGAGRAMKSVSTSALKGAGAAVKGASAIKELLPKRDAQTNGPPPNDSLHQDLMFEDLLDLMPVETNRQATPTVIGTVLIAVAGVRAHLGSTHTALSIANYLSGLGHSTAIIESNYSQDFDRIHSLYEGEKQFLKKEQYFEINGVHHYKQRDSFDLNELYSAYEYVIIDFGDLQEAAGYTEEFKRAHIRLTVCSGDEWKTHWIDEFLKQNRLSKADCTFIIPNGTTAKAEDLQEQLNYLDVYHFPTQENPYEPTKDAEHLMHELLSVFLKSPTRSFSKKTLIATSVISIAITILLFAIFNYL